MKRLLLLSASLLLATSAFAQSLQPITVQEYHERADKTPLEGVGVTVTNAGAAMTSTQGEATLRFRTLHAGDRVQVRRIELPGYEVFNQEALDQWTISPAVPFRIVLCKSDRLRSLREHYMRIASANYDRQFKADQARLAQQRKQSKLLDDEYQRQMQALQDQYDQQLENLDNYVDQFARIDLAELSQQESALIDLIQRGQTDEAIALYEKHNYPALYEQQSRELTEIKQAQQRLADLEETKRQERKAVEASINRQVVTYQLAGGTENWAKITALLKGVADADTTNTEALWRYIEHCTNQSFFDEGEKYIGIYERQAKNNPAILANAYYGLSTIEAQILQYEKAELHLLQGIEILKQYNNVREDMLKMKCYLHTLYCEQYEFEKARIYTDAIEQELMDEDASDVWEKLVMLRSQKAKCIAFIDGDLTLGEQIAVQNIDYCKQHMSEKPTDNEQNTLLKAIIPVYDIFDAAEKKQQLETYMGEVTTIYEQLYNRDPKQFLMGIEEAYANLADTQIGMDKLAEAEANILRALPLLQQLIEAYGNRCSINEMCLYDTAASLYLKKNEAEKSADFARRCMDAFRRMPAQMQEAYREVEERWSEK